MPLIVSSGSNASTVRRIITLALKDIGVLAGRETATDDEITDGLDTLNQMLAYWRTQSLVVPFMYETTIACDSSASYSVGTGEEIDIERPCTIDAVKWVLNGVGTPLIPLHSFQDYQDIQVNTLEGTPSAFYYRPAYPEGELFVWPIPNAGELSLTIRQPMPIYATVQEDIGLPAEYESAIRFNLATWMASTFGMDVPPKIERLARETKRALKINNTQLKTMRMPDAVQSTTMYNIRSGY
jgi:hypothetical protein